MYSREKRRFVRSVINQYERLGRPKGRSRYCQENRRLRDYAEALFLALGQKRATLVTENDVQLALSLTEKPAHHEPQFRYVAQLAIGAITGETPKPFRGVFKCTMCDGNYQHTDDGHYACDGCGVIGQSDQHGFPNSLPASAEVRYLRGEFHQMIKHMQKHGVLMEEAYMLVADAARMPLPTVHAGLCTTKDEINRLIDSAKTVLQSFESEKT